jgi:hypothetical protein
MVCPNGPAPISQAIRGPSVPIEEAHDRGGNHTDGKVRSPGAEQADGEIDQQ